MISRKKNKIMGVKSDAAVEEPGMNEFFLSSKIECHFLKIIIDGF